MPSARAKHSVAGAIVTLIALALFVYLVSSTGLSTILGHIRLLGSTMLLLVAIAAARQVLRTIAWQLCIEPGKRTVSFLELSLIRLAGESITALTFAGPLLGETAKAVVVSRRMPAADSVPSIVVENIVYTFSIALLILAGTFVFLFEYALPERTQVAGGIAGVGALAALAGFAVALSRRWSPARGAMARMRRSERLGRLLAGRDEKIRSAEAAVHDFFAARKGALALVLLFELLACLPGIVEAYIILYVTTGAGSWEAALVLESVLRIVNTLFAFIPLRVGVDEGGAALVLGALGIGAATGVSLAIIRKIRTLIWVAAGVAVFGWYALVRTDRDAPVQNTGTEESHPVHTVEVPVDSR